MICDFAKEGAEWACRSARPFDDPQVCGRVRIAHLDPGFARSRLVGHFFTGPLRRVQSKWSKPPGRALKLGTADGVTRLDVVWRVWIRGCCHDSGSRHAQAALTRAERPDFANGSSHPRQFA